MTPRIGIATYGRNERGRVHLPETYVAAVRRAGGMAFLLPPGEPRISEWAACVDALVLPGGVDVDPARYGQPAHAETDAPDRERDESELFLARHAVAARLPALCICRGLQVLNVALGGTLLQHLPDEVGTRVVHQQKGEYVPHDVIVAPDSRLAALLGTSACRPASSHHQAIGTPAPGLRVVARAPDGTIEAVELAEHAGLIAVQWHPEHTAAEDPVQQRLFDALVRAAELRAAAR